LHDERSDDNESCPAPQVVVEPSEMLMMRMLMIVVAVVLVIKFCDDEVAPN
jgi:hypothetical protein